MTAHRVDHDSEILVLSEEDGHVSPPTAALLEFFEGAGDPLRLLEGVHCPIRDDVALEVTIHRFQGVGLGIGFEPDLIGDIEDRLSGASVESESLLIGGLAVLFGEVFREELEVLSGCPAPLVDRLVLVAYGDHGETRIEDAHQEHALGRVGVLILVKDYGSISLLDGGGQLGIVVDDSSGERHQIGVVHHSKALFVGGELDQRFGHLPPRFPNLIVVVFGGIQNIGGLE